MKQMTLLLMLGLLWQLNAATDTPKPITQATSLQAEIQQHSQQPAAPFFSWQDITQKPSLVQVSLAPNGEQLAYLRREDAGVSLWLMNLQSKQHTLILNSGIVQRIHWSKDSRRLYLESPQNMAFVDVNTAQPRPELFVQFNPDHDESFYAIDTSQAAHILIQRELKSSEKHSEQQLVRVAIDGKQTVIYADEKRVYDHLFDDAGHLKFVRKPGDSRHEIYHLDGDKETLVFSSSVVDKIEMVRFNSDTQELILVGYHDRDLISVHAHNIVNQNTRIVHQDPQKWADLGGLEVDHNQGTVLLASYLTDRNRVYALHPAMQTGVELIQTTLDGSISINASLDTPFWLVRQWGAHIGHTKYHVYDVARQHLRPILSTVRQRHSSLSAEQLSQALPVSYPASDGMMIHGYVMLPKGQNLRQTPLLVYVHGGPFNRIDGGFTSWQYLVNRGYALFMPNFRSSKGYGMHYMSSGKAQFSTRVQQDIIDGIKYLHNQGIAQPGRVGVFGHSFGGYSVLALLSSYPGYFRAGYASAAPTELLNTLFKLDKKDINRYDGIPLLEAISTLIVDLNNDSQQAQMKANAPANLWMQITDPLMIWAGALDERVPIVYVRDHASRLYEAGHNIEFVVDQQTGHNFSQQDELGQQAYRWLIEDFFARHFDHPRPDLSTATKLYLTKFKVY